MLVSPADPMLVFDISSRLLARNASIFALSSTCVPRPEHILYENTFYRRTHSISPPVPLAQHRNTVTPQYTPRYTPYLCASLSACPPTYLPTASCARALSLYCTCGTSISGVSF